MQKDLDQSEQQEWLAALEVLIEEKGLPYAQHIINALGAVAGCSTVSDYWNSELETEVFDVAMSERSSALIRWNAAMMVLHAAEYGSEIGGHLSTFASSYGLIQVGEDVFFKGSDKEPGDLVFYQGHASPGNYAKSYLLGDVSLQAIKSFRREVSGKGLSSYPHPWLMPDYWQFPTVSMGLGPLQAIYQAKLLKYLSARGLLSTEHRRVFAIVGDGEMDEVESLGALGVASRENLDNLIFVVNCNLVRLDGPCRGSGQIIQELGQYFSGYGWDVIKVVWSQAWLDLVKRDTSGVLQSALMRLKDGEIQAIYATKHGVKDWLIQQGMQHLISDWTDAMFKELLPAGHDLQLVANAYKTAVVSKKPSVILVMTEKGHGLPDIANKNTSHNQKKLTASQAKKYIQFLGLDKEIKAIDFYHPGKKDERVQYLKACRDKLGGTIPKRQVFSTQLKARSTKDLLSAMKLDVSRSFSTTMAFVRVLNIWLRDKSIAEKIVPILADEGRTLGMEGLFSKIGIYQPGGQQYQSYDEQEINAYKESSQGQLIQEGLNEAGAMAMWTACATSYSVNALPLLPIYAFYSMFGFQRVGDLIYAAADSRSRGFLIGATAGKTTLGGEGLQHNDGTSLLTASTIPNCKSYDPCFAYELAVIMQYGFDEMMVKNKDVFYYITVMNENYPQPPMPKGVEEGIKKGMYCITKANSSIDLLASGTILRQAMLAQEWLQHELGIQLRVWSVTSFCELYREAENAKFASRVSYLDQCLEGSQLVIACSDYVKALPGLIHEHVNRPYVTLGTDGFGMSDTRQALRDYFGLSHQAIAKVVIQSMVDASLLDVAKAKRFLKKVDRVNPLTDDRRTS